jgi:cell division protease FtsH
VKRREELEMVAQELLEKEIIFQSDLERLIGKRPFEGQTTYEAYTNGSHNEDAEEKETPTVDANEETKLEENKDVSGN